MPEFLADLLGRIVPQQAGALWIGALVAFLVFGDHDRLVSRRNGALLALLAPALFLYDILDLRPSLTAWSFRGVFIVTGLMALWGVRLALRPWADWRPNVPLRALRVVALSLMVMTTSAVLVRAPDDAGIYTSLGAQRWSESGQLPYGDETLKGPDAPAFGAAATYGPLLYVIHLPFQWLLGPPDNSPDADPRTPEYAWPPLLATQLASWSMLLLGFAGFFLIARTQGDRRLAWAMLATLSSVPYFVGLGGDEYVIGGVRFISHIAPMAVTLLAFLLLQRPFWSGVLLATAAGVLFYPAFLFPIWLAWFLFRREGAGRFALGFTAAGAAVALGVIFFTQAPPGQSAVGLFLESTLEHQEGTGALEYGGSTFSFWALHPGLAAIFQTPLIGETSLFKLSFVLFLGFCGVLCVLARGRTPIQLAGLTAAAAAAIQLWKTHATGSYVEWYLPFLMIALFAQAKPSGSSETTRGANGALP